MKMPFRNLLPLHGLVAALFLLSSFCALFAFWRGPGWPVNHEDSAMAMRVLQYVSAVHRGEWLPIWSPEENFGLGSPMALFYPRLFIVLCTLPVLAGVPVKAALILVLTLFSTLGAWGCYRSLRELRLPFATALLLGLAFPHLNYVFTDLVVRGATAEFTAMCVLPWLLWWCLRLIRSGHFGYTIIPIGAGLFFAHTGIFAFAVPMGAGAFLIAVFRHRAMRQEMFNAAFRSALALGVLLAPFLLLIALVRESYLFDLFYMYGNCPKHHYPAPFSFLFSTNGWRYPVINPQLDMAFSVALFAIGALLVVQAYRSRKFAAICRKRLCFIGYFLGLTVLYFFLMLELSWPLYLQFEQIFLALQFPWRLLTYASILEIFGLGLVLSLLTPLTNRRIPVAIAATVLFATVAINLARPAPARIDAEEFNTKRTSNWFEYMPVSPSFGIDAEKLDVVEMIGELRRKCQEWLSLRSKVPPRAVGDGVKELKINRAANKVDWEVAYRSEAPFRLELPMLWDFLAVAMLENNEGKLLLNTTRTPEDPGLAIEVPAGNGIIRVFAPSWSNLIRKSVYPAAAQ